MPFFPPSGTGGGTTPTMANEQFVVLVDGQTVFNLASVPTSAIFFLVNGTTYEDGVDFNVAGNVVAWTDAKFTLKTTDDVQVFYLV